MRKADKPRLQAVRAWFLGICSLIAITAGAILGYGFSRNQQDGPEKFWQAIGKVLAFGGGVIASLMGGWSSNLDILLVLMTTDYFVGLGMAAAGKSKKTKSGKLSSKVGYRGIAKKLAMLGIVAIGACIDKVLGYTSVVRDAFVLFYIVNEIISIFEHARKLNVKTPPVNKLLDKLLDQAGAVGEAEEKPETENKQGSGIG